MLAKATELDNNSSMHYPGIFYIFGLFTVFFSLFMLTPAVVGWWFADGQAAHFLFTSMGTFFVGGSLCFMFKRQHFEINHRDGILLTCLTWTGLSFIGAVPLWLIGVATPLDALFEVVSGLTTTGASIFSNIESLPASILFWRALLQWLGGMGIVVLAIAILPFLGVGGMQLYRSEMPGVTKDKLQPRLHKTAATLWFIYTFLTLCCAAAYWVAGMGWFDAICHAFTTVATAGFANYDASFAHFNSQAIENIAVVFMILGALNFATHFQFLRRPWSFPYGKIAENKIFFALLTASIFTGATVLHLHGASEPFRLALFNLTSIVTTTGFSTTNFALWPPVLLIMILLLSFVGGCSGSTAGGMKVLRIMLIFRQGQREMSRLLHPHGVQHIKMHGQPVPMPVLQAVWAFVGLFVISFAVIALLLAASGVDVLTAFSASAATLANVGPGIGGVGPEAGYGHLPDSAKLILCLAMLLGRLELFTLLMLVYPPFWRR